LPGQWLSRACQQGFLVHDGSLVPTVADQMRHGPYSVLQQ
jgi:hypothetical protein